MARQQLKWFAYASALVLTSFVVDEVAKVEKFKIGAVKVAYLDIHGTYLKLSRPLAPMMSLATEASLRLAASRVLCRRLTSAVRSCTSVLR